MAQYVLFTLIRWLAIDPLDGAIHPLSNWASVEIKRVSIVSKINPGLYVHAGSLFEAMFSFLNRIRKIGSF